MYRPMFMRPMLLSVSRRIRALLSRPDVGGPLTAFVVSRLAVFLAAYLSAVLIADRLDVPPYHLRGTSNALVDVLGSRWDSGFYVSIAEQGYQIEGDPFPTVPFFPLLPLAMRALATLFGDVVLAGIVISNLSLLAAGFVIFQLVEARAGAAVANRAVWYLMIFPTSLFGSAVYTESLFLLTSAGAIYLARRGAWESASLLGYFAALTRFAGLVIAPVLFVEWWVQRRRLAEGNRAEGQQAYGRQAVGRQAEGQRAPVWAVSAPMAVLAGTATYMAYLAWRFDDALAFVHASSAWGRRPSSPMALLDGLLIFPAGGWWAALKSGALPISNMMDLGFVILFFGLGLWLLKRRWWTEAAFVLVGVALAASSGLLMSQGRYIWVLFPAFVPLAMAGGRPWFDRLYTALSIALLALFTALLANGYWVG